jgi:hypothetical protein
VITERCYRVSAARAVVVTALVKPGAWTNHPQSLSRLSAFWERCFVGDSLVIQRPYRSSNDHSSKEITYVVQGNGCHPCVSHALWKGYPVISTDGKTRRLHRMVFEWEYGPVPFGMCVCHSCDNRACINPEHLFLGTNRDNTMDKVAKGRQARYEKHGTARFTWEIVRDIRESKGRIGAAEWARKLGTNRNYVDLIRAGRTWKS